MDAGTRARIFEPFFSRREGSGGTGMGLAMVHGITRAHGGFVGVESEPGRGTTFRVFLPALAAGTPEDVGEPSEPAGRLQGLRVLVVDDEAPVLEVTTRALTRSGAEACRAKNVEEALAAASRERFDVVVTDLTMPGQSGLALAATLHDRQPALPVVLMSGQSALLDPAELAQAGVRASLAKPFSMSELVATIARVVA